MEQMEKPGRMGVGFGGGAGSMELACELGNYRILGDWKRSLNPSRIFCRGVK